MFLLGALIGTTFGVTIMAILSSRAYDKGFSDGCKIERLLIKLKERGVRK